MANEFLKPEAVVNVGLEMLDRELVLAPLVWRDAGGDYAGKKNDTVTIRVPIYATARTRVLRSGTTRTRDELHETGVDVKLDVDVYKDLVLTGENLTLDIVDFASQVMNPNMQAMARSVEDELIDEIAGASYEDPIDFSYGSDDAWKDLILAARRALNDRRVPSNGRVLACGSGIEEALLGTDLFVKANESGSTTALSEATVGNKAGFRIVGVPGLDPDEAYAFHKSAYVLSVRAPAVSEGFPWGASLSRGGVAMRAVRGPDMATVEDVLAFDTYVGTGIVTDKGTITDGIFTPAEDPDASGVDDLFVRAVQIQASS